MMEENAGYDAVKTIPSSSLGSFPLMPYMDIKGKNKEEQKVSLGKINIHGNWRTCDSTIEDEFDHIKLTPGMTPSELNKNIFDSLQSLKSLNIFEKVEIEQREVSQKEYSSTERSTDISNPKISNSKF